MTTGVQGSSGVPEMPRPPFLVTAETLGDEKVPSIFRGFVKPYTYPKPLVAQATVSLLQDWSSWLAGLFNEGGVIPVQADGRVNLSSQTRNCIMNAFIATYDVFKEARNGIESLKDKKGHLTAESARKNFSCMRLFNFARLSSFLAFSLTASYGLLNKFATAMGNTSFPCAKEVSSISSYLFAVFGIAKIMNIGIEHRKIQKIKHELFETSALARIGYCFQKAASYLRVVDVPKKLNERVSVTKQVENLKKMWTVSDQEAIDYIGGRDKLQSYFAENITPHLESMAGVLGLSKEEVKQSQGEVLQTFKDAKDSKKLNPAFAEYIQKKLGIDVEKSGLSIEETMALVMVKAELLKAKQSQFLDAVCEGTKDKIRTREMIETTLKMRSICSKSLTEGDIQEAEKILMTKLQSSMNRKDWKNVASMLFFAFSVASVIASLATPMGPSVVLAFFILSILLNTVSYAISMRDFAVAIEDETLAPPRQRELSKSPFISSMQTFAEKRLPREEKFWLIGLINLISIGLIIACCVLNPPGALLIASSAITIGLYSVTQFMLQFKSMREKAAVLANKIDYFINQPIASFFDSALEVQKQQLERFEALKMQYEHEKILSRIAMIPIDKIEIFSKQYDQPFPLFQRVRGKLKPVVGEAARSEFLATPAGKQSLKNALIEEVKKDPKKALEKYWEYKKEVRITEFTTLQAGIAQTSA